MSDFRFFPRPEANAMAWQQLLPPVRDAVRNLLLRLNGATTRVTQTDVNSGLAHAPVVTNCFLVFGDRGTGKTTVLLSAQKAVRRRDSSFFKCDQGPQGPKKSAEDAAADLRKKNLVWLELLDLEPMPLGANLLTTLLTRVRDALDSGDGASRHPEATSLFEESEDSARQQLQRLISDATLMWEDISEQDTRSRANREIKAADIYASFRRRFTAALSKLASELQRLHGGDEPPAIVLPIDNIDRSTEHLHSIIKLAKMVNSRHLWLVMAGDRVDLDTFLERAYWKELIRVGQGAGAAGKTGPRGEDEAYVMARQQAAAASQKLLPPSHRIEVQRVEAEDTLRFSLSHGCICGEAHDSDTAPTIRDLLSKVSVPLEKSHKSNLYFIDLLDMRKLLSDKGSELRLSFTSKQALWLPARNVIDLWQLAHWVVNDQYSFCRAATRAEPPCLHDDAALIEATCEFRAEKIARTMLRYAITASEISSELGRRLQNDLIGRNVRGGTSLDFDDSPLSLYRLTTLEEELRRGDTPVGKGDWVVRSKLILNQIDGVIIAIGKKGASETRNEPEPLPGLAAAWLAILHDIVALAPESCVVSSRIRTAPFVKAHHSVVVSNKNGSFFCTPDKNATHEFGWRAPTWRLFVAHEVFRKKWKSCIEKLASGKSTKPDEFGPRLVYCWVACVLETFAVFFNEIGTGLGESILCGNSLTREVPEGKGSTDGAQNPFDVFSEKVVDCTNTLYSTVRKEADEFDAGQGAAVVNQWATMMRDWFELELPLLLSYAYTPFCQLEDKWRTSEIPGELVNAWDTNEPLIRGDLNKSLRGIFSAEDKQHSVSAEDEQHSNGAVKTFAKRFQREYENWPKDFKSPVSAQNEE